MTFTDLQPGQLCTFVVTQDDFQDVCRGAVTSDGALVTFVSLQGTSFSKSITSEYVRKRCTLISADEVLSLDPADYPEILL